MVRCINSDLRKEINVILVKTMFLQFPSLFLKNFFLIGLIISIKQAASKYCIILDAGKLLKM